MAPDVESLVHDGNRLLLVDGALLTDRVATMAEQDREGRSAAWLVLHFLCRLDQAYHSTHMAWVEEAWYPWMSEQRPRVGLIPPGAAQAWYRTPAQSPYGDVDPFGTMTRLIALGCQQLGVPYALSVSTFSEDPLVVLIDLARRAEFRVSVVTSEAELYPASGDGVEAIVPGRLGPDGLEWEWLSRAGVLRRLGMPPGRIRDYQCLCGAKGVNVPGAALGHDDAVRLLTQFPSLDLMLEHPEQIGDARLREVVGARAAEISLAMLLLRYGVAPLAFGLEDLRFRAKPRAGYERPMDDAALGAWLLSLGDLPGAE